MTNVTHTVLYTGVTCNLQRRVYQHKSRRGSKFSSRYNITKLVYCERFNDVASAIAREKQIKAGSRKRKLDLIRVRNKDWRDLYLEL